MSGSHVASAGLVVLALVVAVLTARALRRDETWVRTREAGPLDFLPVRARAKRVHLGLRLGVIVVALALAAGYAANDRTGYLPTPSHLFGRP